MPAISFPAVELQGTYGGDLTHALSAWTSTHRDLSPDREKRIPQLMKQLAGEDPEHGSPFEKSFIHFLVICDTASHIHQLKHRIAVSVNGESARYKEHTEDKYHIPDDWPLEERVRLERKTLEMYQEYHAAIERLEPTLGRKRAKESARFYLPYASALTLDVSFNFRSFAHFQRLRNHLDAQREIRLLAQRMLELVRGTGDFDASLKAFGLTGG